jgi:nicotinic acid mononucleotide adenylyltransferase
MDPARLSAAERRRLAPLAAAIARAKAPGPPRLELVAGTVAQGRRHGLLAGTFNPFTRAHAALAVAGHRAGCDRVVLAMAPTSLDKEAVERAHPVDRLDWARGWAARHRWAAVAVSSHPLLVDMAEALRAAGAGEAVLLVGTDKAAQLVEPRYYADPEAAMARLTATASVMVAERAGVPHAQRSLPGQPLATPASVAALSATEARALAADGGDLRALLPAPVARAVERTRAYDRDPAPYLARAHELDRLGGLPSAALADQGDNGVPGITEPGKSVT